MAAKRKRKPLTIGNSNEDADWIKSVRGGKAQKDDLKAHDEALKLHKKREREKKRKGTST